MATSEPTACPGTHCRSCDAHACEDRPTGSADGARHCPCCPGTVAPSAPRLLTDEEKARAREQVFGPAASRGTGASPLSEEQQLPQVAVIYADKARLARYLDTFRGNARLTTPRILVGIIDTYEREFTALRAKKGGWQ